MTDHLTYDPVRRVLLDENGLAFARDVGLADAIRVTEALSICADLPSVLRDVVETHIYDTANGDVIDPEDPLMDLAKRAENVTADEPEGAPPAPTVSPTLDAILSDMMAYEAEAFEVDDPVDGGDLVEAFSQWRKMIRTVLASHRPFSAPPIGLLEIAGDLSAAICSLDHQVEQMKGMFPDDDGTIRQAQDDGDEARQRLAMYRKAVEADPVKIVVVVSGGVITEVGFSRDCPGLEVVTVDYDTDDETDPSAVEMVAQPGAEAEGDPEWEPAYVCRYSTDDACEPRPLAAMRPATAEDLA